MIPDLTAAVGAPRVAAIEFPFGRPLGQPGDAGTQRAVLRATLQGLADAAAPGSLVELPFRWPEPPAEVRWHPKEPSPLGRFLASDPAAFRRLLAGEVPAAASRRVPVAEESLAAPRPE